MKTFSLVLIIVLLVIATGILVWQGIGLVKAIITRVKAKKAKALEDNRKE